MDLALGSFRALIYRLTGTFSWAAIGVITARWLDVDERGTYVSIIAVTATIGAVSPSFSSATGYFVSNRKRRSDEIASNAAVLAVVVGLLQVAACMVGWAFYTGDGRNLIPLIALGLLPATVRSAISGIYLGTGQLARYTLGIYGPAYFAMVTVVIWVVVLGHHSAVAAAGSFVIAQALSLLVLVVMERSWWRWLRAHPPDVALMRAIVSFGLVTGFTGAIGLLNFRADQLLVARFDGREGVAVYASAVNLAEGVWLFSNSISIASFARVGSLSHRESADLTSRAIRHSIPVVLGLAGAVFLLAPFLITAIYGDRYGGGTASLRILCVATAVYAPYGFLITYFTTQLGRPRIGLLLNVLGCVVNIGVGTLLIRQYGYVGGAWGTLAGYSLSMAAATYLFLRMSGAPASDLWRVGRDDISSYFRLSRRILRGQIFGRA